MISLLILHSFITQLLTARKKKTTTTTKWGEQNYKKKKRKRKMLKVTFTSTSTNTLKGVGGGGKVMLYKFCLVMKLCQYDVTTFTVTNNISVNNIKTTTAAKT